MLRASIGGTPLARHVVVRDSVLPCRHSPRRWMCTASRPLPHVETDWCFPIFRMGVTRSARELFRDRPHQTTYTLCLQGASQLKGVDDKEMPMGRSTRAWRTLLGAI